MTSAASSAAAAASCPLLPALPPARSTACCIVSTVSTPKPTGRACCTATAFRPARRLARHVLEVRRVAPDHGAERHEAGVALGAGRGGRRDRQLERARHPHDVHVLARDARPPRSRRGRPRGAGW